MNLEEEEDARPQGLWIPKTPAKQNHSLKHGSLLIRDEKLQNCNSEAEGVFDLNKITLASDHAIENHEGFVYMESWDTSKGLLAAEVSKTDCNNNNNNNEVLTFGDEEKLPETINGDDEVLTADAYETEKAERKKKRPRIYRPKVVGFGRPKTPKKATPTPKPKASTIRIPESLEKIGMKFPKTLRKPRMARRRCERWSGMAIEVVSNNHGMLVPYGDQLGILTRYKGNVKINKRLAKLSPAEGLLSLLWKDEIRDKVKEGQGKEGDEEYWNNEREVFHGRIKLLISKMHLIQGDRRFSQWKGSVVDSIVGVFLTQNVSDHLSSSAFMSLAARFNKTDCKEVDIVASQESIGSNIVSIEPVSDEDEELVTCQPGFSKEGEINELSSENSNEIEATAEQKISTEIVFLEQQEKESYWNEQQQYSDMEFGETKKKKNGKAIVEARTDWDFCRKIYSSFGERNRNHLDSVDWEAVRHAQVGDIADSIKARGQQNIIAGRIKKFLNQVYEDHKQIDLEWLRNAPPNLVSKYLRDIEGIGLKSIECVRLLALQHVAFPVDVNVGRIAIRLGWVPLQPLPESLQLHLLQEMPVLDNIQKYLWPRLRTLDPKTLYELHYQLITFGKVYCTKRNPNCNSCPMKGECRYYASAFASARLALPGPKKKSDPSKNVMSTSSDSLIVPYETLNPPTISFLEANHELDYETPSNCEPIIEEPSSPPQQELTDIPDIEDLFLGSPKRKLIRDQEVSMALKPYVSVFQESDMSNELVASQVTYTRVSKLKDVERLRTKHLVFVLPDNHPLLEMVDRREPDDPSPYLLAIWTSDKTKNSFQEGSNVQDSSEETCFSDNNLPEASDTIHGTIIIPCRTANRGSFPLNGTYFQVNEVFTDHESSKNPIKVARSLLWNLERRIAYFGASTSAILKGLPTEETMECFYRGFICVRGYDRKTRTPQQLEEKFHISTTMTGRKRKTQEHER